MPDDGKRELPRITVPARIDTELRRIAAATERTIVWHRRRAYEEYVAAHENDRVSR